LVDDLQHQITPAELLNQLVTRRHANRSEPSLAHAIAAQVSKNPLACMLIGAGIAWLVISDKMEKQPERKRVIARSAPRARKKRRASNKKAA
jgi:hypothetical protein